MTSRRLILMRHGSAEPGHAMDDHERSLTVAGRAEAARVGVQLDQRGWSPDLVRGSDARRTRETWDCMVGCFAEPQSVTWTEDLYLSSLTSVVVDAQGWDAAAGAVLCLGHNPGWSAAAFRLSGIRVGMGTAYAALLEGEGDDWAEAFTRPWTLVELLRP